jgi:hypothetical protein
MKKWISKWWNSPPPNWCEHHHEECGTRFRGCHPTRCPKDQYEKTGVWRRKPKGVDPQFGDPFFLGMHSIDGGETWQESGDLDPRHRKDKDDQAD